MRNGAFRPAVDPAVLVGRSWAEIARIPFAPVRYYVREFPLRIGAGPAFLTAYGGDYKTTLALHIAKCLQTGELLFGAFPILERPAYSIVISIDMPGEDAERRIKNLGGPPSDKVIFYDWSSEGFSLDAFTTVLRRYPNSFVIVDCYADIAADAQEQRSNDAQGLTDRALIKKLRHAFEENCCDGFILDHTSRPGKDKRPATEQYAGTQAKRSTIRSAYTMQRAGVPADPIRNEAGKPVAYLEIASMKRGEFGGFEPFTVAFVQTVNRDQNGDVIGESHEPVLVPTSERAKTPATAGTVLRDWPDALREAALKLHTWWPDPERDLGFNELRSEEHGVAVNGINGLKNVLNDARYFTRLEHKRKVTYLPLSPPADTSAKKDQSR
jgi:hypothetical protein